MQQRLFALNSTDPDITDHMISRLAHLCLRTDKFDEIIALYRDDLGLPIKFDLKDGEGVTFGYYFDLGNLTFLEIFDHQRSAKHWNLPADPIQRPTVTHYSHFCLETDKIEELREKFLTKGLKSTGISVGMDASAQMWITDPDGNSVEIMEYTPASLQLKDSVTKL